MIQSYIALVKNHFAIIASGFLLIFFSVFGQTAFVGVFMPNIREEFGLSQSEIGTYYGLATFLSALIVIWTGKKFDDVPMLRFLSMVFAGLALGCFILAIAPNVIVLFLAFLMLRQFGQGLMVFASSTSINRYLDHGRGRAMAIASFAAPLQIAIFPFLGYQLLEISGWQNLWIGFGLFVLIFLWPLFFFLLKDHQKTTHALWVNKITQQENDSLTPDILHKTRIDALKDWKFYALAAVMIVPPCFTTAIFFFQADLAASKSISPQEFAGSLSLFTALSIATSVISGVMIDKYGEAPSLALQPILYCCGLALMVFTPSAAMLILGLGLVGASEGFARTTGGPVLARLYGTKHLGAVKSMLFSVIIVSSAVSPALVGFLLDEGFGLLEIFTGFVVYILFAFCVLIPVLKHLWDIHLRDMEQTQTGEQ